MNEVFLDRMKNLLNADYEDYLKTLELPAYKGIRLNLLKTNKQHFISFNSLILEQSPFCEEGFYLTSGDKVGKSIEHIQGLYYVQEPSATSAVTILDPQKGDWVLDLCAAPGGKSTQIASRLQNTGFLLSNEINNARAQVLLSNMERCGVSEAMITNAFPEKLCEVTKGWFDKVLVDAPCSGEGMFKKEDQASLDWSVEHVQSCSERQINILDSAYKALKKDGILVYSTCTYSIDENEHVISEFMQRHPDMEQLDPGVHFGRRGIDEGNCDGSKVVRIFPMDKGEGHFVAKMVKRGESETSRKVFRSSPGNKVVQQFLKEQLNDVDGYILVDNDHVYIKKEPFIQLDKIKVLREGCKVGDLVKNRLEPHHHFYICENYEKKDEIQIELNEKEVNLFLSGEVLNHSCTRGYVCLTYRGTPIGFGKSDGNQIKNKFPKGLRI